MDAYRYKGLSANGPSSKFREQPASKFSQSSSQMNTSLTETVANQSSDFKNSDSGSDLSSLDRTLTEIRSGRRLEKIVASIENFLNSQITRLEKAMAECNESIENDRIVQRILAEFEVEKAAWEESRQAEIMRLQVAGEELIKGWEKLEEQRKK